MQLQTPGSCGLASRFPAPAPLRNQPPTLPDRSPCRWQSREPNFALAGPHARTPFLFGHSSPVSPNGHREILRARQPRRELVGRFCSNQTALSAKSGASQCTELHQACASQRRTRHEGKKQRKFRIRTRSSREGDEGERERLVVFPNPHLIKREYAQTCHANLPMLFSSAIILQSPQFAPTQARGRLTAPRPSETGTLLSMRCWMQGQKITSEKKGKGEGVRRAFLLSSAAALSLSIVDGGDGRTQAYILHTVTRVRTTMYVSKGFTAK